jgi:hypothetical protein
LHEAKPALVRDHEETSVAAGGKRGAAN